jgi:hypothetical protein
VIGTDIYGCKDTSSIRIEFSYCTGLDANANQVRIGLFPNPNDGSFTLEAPFDLQLQVVNGLGQVVKEIILSQGSSRNVDLTDLSPGVYFLTGQHETMRINEKIIINE